MDDDNIQVEITPEEAEVFDRVMQRLRAAAPTEPYRYRWFGHANFDTKHFSAYCMWSTGDEGDGLPTAPQWRFHVQYLRNGEHCDGRGVYYHYPLRQNDGKGIQDRDRVDCPGCVACQRER